MTSGVPLLDLVGTRNVNAALLLLYTLFVGCGIATILLVAIFASETWPLALALAFVCVVSLAHGSIIVTGAVLVPDYVFYPTRPRWLYIVADAVFLLCFVNILASYGVDSTSSTVPLFTTFFVVNALLVHLYKLVGLVFPDGIGGVGGFGIAAWFGRAPKSANAGASGAGVGDLSFPGTSSRQPSADDDYDYYDDYEDDEDATESMPPGARKLAVLLKAHRQKQRRALAAPSRRLPPRRVPETVQADARVAFSRGRR